MNNLKVLLLLVFTVICFSSVTINFAAAHKDSQYIQSSGDETVTYEFIDGVWYKVTWDSDGRIVDREAQE